MQSLNDIIAADPTLTDEQVQAAYVAQSPEPRRAPIGEVTAYMLPLRLLGRLTLVVHSTAMPATLRAAVAELLGRLTINDSLDGTDPAIAADVAATLAGLVQAGTMTQPEADGFSALVVTVPAATLGNVAAARRSLAFAAIRNAATMDHARRIGLIDAAERDGLPVPTLSDLDAGGGA